MKKGDKELRVEGIYIIVVLTILSGFGMGFEGEVKG